MTRSTKIFFVVFFAAILASIVGTYYAMVLRQDYTVFTDPNNVPDPADFVGEAILYFKAL